MAHEIKADSNTYVGYNFLTNEYYVRNLDTKTAAKTAYEAKLVLDITAPRNVISEEAIQALSKTYEPITSINYTLEDTGRYIKTIYFNDYKSFAIQYDEPSLYIRGSNEMWDMSSTLGVDSIITFFWQYFVYHLGLNMPQELIAAIISYYKDIQRPYVYNIIESRTEKDISENKPLIYTNQFKLNNANGLSRGEYIGIKNPDNEYSLNKYKIIKGGYDHIIESFDVSSVEKNKFKINLSNLYPNAEDIFKGKQVEIFGTGVIDGIYKISGVENDVDDPETNTDKPVTHLKVDSSTPFEKDFVPLYSQNILRLTPVVVQVESITINNTEHAINLTETPPSDLFKVNDEIEIFGTNVIDDCYIIKSISGTKIIIDGKFKEAYTPEYNKWILRTAGKKTVEKSITCLEEPACKIGDLLQITTNEELLGNYTVELVSGNKIYLNKEIKEIKSDNNAYAWCNAYKVNYCGYTQYHEVCESMQIKSISGAVVKLYGLFDSSNYNTNMTAYIGNEKFSIKSVTYPSYNNQNQYAEGSITLSATPTKNGYVYDATKEPLYLEVRKTYKIPENSFTLNAPLPLSKGDTFELFNNTSINGTYKIDYVETIDSTYKVHVIREKGEDNIPELTFSDNDKNSGIIQTRAYSDKILLNITYSRLSDRTPVGEFMLDNDTQLTQYLELYRIVTPTIQNYIDFGQPVTMKHYLGEGLLIKDEPTYMNCIGLYSENYEDV